ncbi:MULTISPECIES: F0F1 ATP synthase subunit gamma [Chlorobium/Pelodictyon group]|uniref:H(+)-transporting ATP synthase, subunit gamma n=1 Tax=Chlorobium luteolum (strain DSM 273 / BCRC 81028 / 2530) TaxID=319225 RepID=Q3B3Z8_CHLL3|nr:MULTISPECIES: F0F1 ATP synthase subunit gamma [Chlorobium/Pelodictyon group]ABB23933.1 H(+)-transporting ATP synthase, subunit gamma [Pelodictyon luteolum DSM 273]TCD47409.1 F0F1 ATP synthase subunit gamma [Chlorobium sp. N1]
MSETIETLSRKIERAGMLRSVVRTMKTLAASSIRQYEDAVRSLEDYYDTVELGLAVSLSREPKRAVGRPGPLKRVAIVFGSDQGLVGQFNDVLSTKVAGEYQDDAAEPTILAVGERVHARLSEDAAPPEELYLVPSSVGAITGLVSALLARTEAILEEHHGIEVTLFFNSPESGERYRPTQSRILPLDETWKERLRDRRWPSRTIPQLIGEPLDLQRSLLGEYLFVSLFRASAESLASENSSRLAAMQRAEKNIDDILDSLMHRYHRRRQSMIDEELFDVVSGFTALGGAERKEKRGNGGGTY